MERQKHGFIYEKKIIEEFNLKEELNYTAKWDAFYTDNIPVSIKTKKINTNIELGDFFRQATIDSDFLLLVGFWERFRNNIVREEKLLIPVDFWSKEFDKSLVESFKNIFDGITNSYSDDKRWKERINKANKAWDATGSIIKVHFKRDHKTQKRVQCSIRKEAFEEILIPNFSIENL